MLAFPLNSFAEELTKDELIEVMRKNSRSKTVRIERLIKEVKYWEQKYQSCKAGNKPAAEDRDISYGVGPVPAK